MRFSNIFNLVVCSLMLSSCQPAKERTQASMPVNNQDSAEIVESEVIPTEDVIVEELEEIPFEDPYPDRWDNRPRIVSLNKGVELPDEITLDELTHLILSIPEHGFKEETSWAFTPEYLNVLREAWAVPDCGIGEPLGFGEWLCYFVSGNGDATHNFRIKSVDIVDGEAIVKMKSQLNNTLKLHLIDGDWKIADFDNTLSEMKKYILKQRKYFRSEEWFEYLEASKPYCKSPKEIESLKEYVEDYFKKYPTVSFE